MDFKTMMRLMAILMLILGVGMLNGCGGDDDDDDDGATDADTDTDTDADSDSDADTGPAPCTSDDDCTDQVCDTASGMCVDCLADADCTGTDEICDTARMMCICNSLDCAGHADETAEAWLHWKEDVDTDGNPIPMNSSCDQCHSGTGFVAFLDMDTDFALMPDDQPDVIDCATCHDAVPAVRAVDTVTFPSGYVYTTAGVERICMNCHQGRAYGGQVDADFTDPDAGDTVDPAVGFINVHYYPASATKFGSDAMSGYEYATKTYDPLFAHSAAPWCVDCHDPHSTEINLADCIGCHPGVTDPREITMGGNPPADDIEALEVALYAAIQAYATANADADDIGYDSHSYPYFFIDTDGSGIIEEGEATYGNKYATFTPKLLRACYNYQVSKKEPCGYVHNPGYVMQLLFDSIEDLGGDVSGFTRP